MEQQITKHDEKVTANAEIPGENKGAKMPPASGEELAEIARQLGPSRLQQ